jgi:hypothetical protein
METHYLQKVTVWVLKFQLMEVVIIFDHFNVLIVTEMFFLVPATPTVDKRDGYPIPANKWTVYFVSPARMQELKI